MRRWALLLSLLLFPRVGLAANTLAVTYFESSTKIAELEALKVGLAQMLITDLTGRGDFKVLERAQLQKVLDELELGHSGMTQAGGAQLGKLLGVRYFLFGFYSELMGQFWIDARLVDVEMGVVITAKRVQGKRDDFMAMEAQLASFAAAEMAKLPDLNPGAGDATVPTSTTPTGKDPGARAPGTKDPGPKPAPVPDPKQTTRDTEIKGGVAGDPLAMNKPDPAALEPAQAYSEGLIFLDAGDEAQARDRFQAALASKPNLAHAKSALASMEI